MSFTPRGGGSGGVCSEHGKARSLLSLCDDGTGNMKCRPGMECKTNSGAPPGMAGQFMGGALMCSAHRKQRSAQSLMDDGQGGMRCREGMECKTQGGSSSGVGSGSFNTCLPVNSGGPGIGQWVCSEHGKPRSMQSLIDDGKGGFRCTAGMECKTASSGTQCSLHGKMRSAEVLTSDGQGGLRCIEGKECKTGGHGQASKKGICKYWQEGSCSKGNNCDFRHEGEAGAGDAAQMGQLALGMGAQLSMGDMIALAMQSGMVMPGMAGVGLPGVAMPMDMSGMDMATATAMLMMGGAVQVDSQPGWGILPDGNPSPQAFGAMLPVPDQSPGQVTLPLPSPQMAWSGLGAANAQQSQQSPSANSWKSKGWQSSGWQDRTDGGWQGSNSGWQEPQDKQDSDESGPVRSTPWASARANPY